MRTRTHGGTPKVRRGDVPKRTRIHKGIEAISLECLFFRHCWNEGLKLPTSNNCPECSDQYLGYRQSRVNHRPVYERLRTQFPGDDRRLEISSSENWQEKRFADQGWDHCEEYKQEKGVHEYVW